MGCPDNHCNEARVSMSVYVSVCVGEESGKKTDGWIDGEMEECRE